MEQQFVEQDCDTFFDCTRMIRGGDAKERLISWGNDECGYTLHTLKSSGHQNDQLRRHMITRTSFEKQMH